MKRFIDYKAIVVEARQRREFPENAHQTLLSSIESVGLLQAPVLELIGESYHLRAGERRLRAISDIYDLGGTFSYDNEPVLPGFVPYTLWTDLTPLQRLEIEVDENNQREAFTWAERAEATSKLDALRRGQAELKGAPAPTVAEIAQEIRGSSIGSAHTDTRNDLIIARHLDDPEVRKAKSAKEAMTILKRKEQAKQHTALAKSVGKTFSSSSHTCLNADSHVWAESALADHFDVIITDPPYGMGADSFGSAVASSARAHEYQDDSSVVEKILEWFPRESFRVTKPQAHLYLFLDIDWFFQWRTTLTAAGWRVFRTPLIWIKPTGFRAPWPEQGPQRKYELCLYAIKGNKPVNFIAPDVLQVTSPGEGLGHSAGKPPALYSELLRRSVKPGDLVLDPFCGTGPVFEAAHSLKCLATGVDISPEFYGISLNQIKNLKD